MPSKRVSLIIPFHNRARFLRASVESALSELDPARDEILCVDDGSTDDSAATLTGLPVSLIRLPTSRGPAVARNAGLSAAQGAFVSFLDSDDLLLPGSLSQRIEYLSEHPNEVAVGGTVTDLIDEKGNRISDYDAIHFYKVLSPPYRLSHEFLAQNRSLPLHLWLVLFRSELFKEIGLLNAWLRCGEDLEFFFRLLKHHTVPYIDCPVAQYRIHDDNLSLRKTSEGYIPTPTAIASQYLICQKYGLKLKESPLLMESTYQIHGLTIKLSHPNEPVGNAIEAEFARWKIETTSSAEASFAIEPGKRPDRPAAGAVRTRFWEEFKSYEYQLGSTRFELFGDNYFAKKNFGELRTEISYLKFENLVGQLGCSSFKWLVIKGLEKKGFGYIHGSGLSLNERTILFNGDPGSGKSSCLKRLLARGAKAMSDDTILFKATTLYPFDYSPSVRGDYKERFGVTTANDDVPTDRCVYSPTSQPVAAVIFPRVWEAKHSEWREVSREEGIRRLLQTYVKETEWNSYPEPLDQVRARYEALLSQAYFFEFLAGAEEAGVASLLWSHCKRLFGVP